MSLIIIQKGHSRSEVNRQIPYISTEFGLRFPLSSYHCTVTSHPLLSSIILSEAGTGPSFKNPFHQQHIKQNTKSHQRLSQSNNPWTSKMRSTLLLSLALAAATATAQANDVAAENAKRTASTTNFLEPLGASAQSAVSSFYGTTSVRFPGPNLPGTYPTGSAARNTYLSLFESIQSVQSAAVATITETNKAAASVLSAEVADDAYHLSVLEQSWGITPADAAASTTSTTSTASSTSSNSTSTSNGAAAAPIMTAAPVVLGGVAAAALALL